MTGGVPYSSPICAGACLNASAIGPCGTQRTNCAVRGRAELLDLVTSTQAFRWSNASDIFRGAVADVCSYLPYITCANNSIV